MIPLYYIIIYIGKVLEYDPL